MNAYNELTRRLGDRIEAGYRRTQELQIGAIEQLRGRLAPRLPALPDPLRKRLPRPGAIARANFRLAARVLKAQEAYTLGVIGALGGEPRRRRAVRGVPSR